MHVKNEMSFKKESQLYAYIFNQNGTNFIASLTAFLICNAHLPSSLENKTINIRAVNVGKYYELFFITYLLFIYIIEKNFLVEGISYNFLNNLIQSKITKQ